MTSDDTYSCLAVFEEVTGSLGTEVPIPTLPLDVIRSLSLPSVVTLKCPSEPVSTTSASVFPSEILSVVPVPPLEPEPSPS